MLKTLDILIGVATVMLLFSMAVTIITQAVTALRQHRGKSLLNGLAGLLRQLDPLMLESVAKKISEALLRHPLVAGPKRKLGEVIHREEFTTLLMSIAAEESPNGLEESAHKALVELLKKNGIPEPAETLKDIRSAAVQLEAANPELANHLRQAKAILQEARSQYVAKINCWFDQTIDRVAARFTLTARTITFIAALAVAVAVQLDTFALVNRLSVDDQFRAAVANNTDQLMKDALRVQTAAAASAGDSGTATPGATPTPSSTAPPAPTPAPSATPTPTASPAATGSNGGKTASLSAGAVEREYYTLLSTAGLVTLPGDNWLDRFYPGKIPGILLSALLLSLGAPFWYGRLQDLLRMRSVIAQKDDEQRTTRQTNQALDDGAVVSASVSTVSAVMAGEQGDMNAAG